MDNLQHDDEDYQLPADTLLILQEFLLEKDQREKLEATGATDCNKIEENWQLSQFWYNASTKEKLASVVHWLLKESEPTGNPLRVALLCCPSLYNHVKDVTEDVALFEFDERFASIGPDFHQFDYKLAEEENYLEEFQQCFDLIIADPPFLSKECIEKIGKVVQKISKDDSKTILCSGYAVREWAEKLLRLNLCKFEPEHERNLGNQFSSYANFDLDSVLAEAEQLY